MGRRLEGNMTELNLRFEFSQDDDLNEVSRTLEQRIARLQMVDEVESVPEKMKLTGVEIASAIGVTVLVVRSGRELIGELRKLIVEIKGLAGELRNLKGVFFDVGDERIGLEALNDDHLRRLEEEA
jgi:hypothetical protein